MSNEFMPHRVYRKRKDLGEFVNPGGHKIMTLDELEKIDPNVGFVYPKKKHHKKKTHKTAADIIIPDLSGVGGPGVGIPVVLPSERKRHRKPLTREQKDRNNALARARRREKGIPVREASTTKIAFTDKGEKIAEEMRIVRLGVKGVAARNDVTPYTANKVANTLGVPSRKEAKIYI